MDPHDSKTATFPGIEPAPPKAPRSNVDSRRASAGYMLPKDRESCRSCKHRRERLIGTGTFHESAWHHCGLYRFEVKLGARCDYFDAKRAA